MIPEAVINYYTFKKATSKEQALIIFLKLEKFLSEVFSADLNIPTKEVDEAWHIFILHTKLYEKYCLEKFGRFIHHNPYPLEKNGLKCDAGGVMSSCDKDEEELPPCDAALFPKIQAVNCNADSDGRCDAQFI